MLMARVITALLLIPAVLAAIFLLPTRGWAVLALVLVLISAHEWATLAGF